MPLLATPPKRLYTHYRKLYWTWKWRHAIWNNEHFGGQPWNIVEEWALFVGLDPDGKWFDTYSSYYDGHTTAYFTIFGICFGKMYTYDSKPLED